MSEWTDELKQQVIDMYLEQEPTAETSAEIVTEIAEKIGKTPNGVRMILSKAEVYVKKSAPAKKSEAASSSTGTGATRVNKESAVKALVEAIEKAGHEADMDIIGKLTGKAAVYFTSLIK